MAEKHLTETGWKMLVRNRVRNDAGLGKALVAYAKLGQHGDPDARLDALSEVAESASKLKRDKAIEEMDDVIAWLGDVVKEAGTVRSSLVLLTKSGGKPEKKGDEDEDDGDLLAGLNRVRSGKGELVLKFAACAAKPFYGLAVAKNITPGHKKVLTDATGGRVFLEGVCVFEEGKITFVTGTVKAGLAKQFQKSIKHVTGKQFQVRVRDDEGTIVLDDETDEDEGTDLESVKLRLATVIQGIKRAAALEDPSMKSLLEGAKLAASEAGMLVRKSDAQAAALLVEKAEALLKQAVGDEKPKREKTPISEFTSKVCGTLAKSGDGKYAQIEALNSLMLESVEYCPELAKHFGDVLGGKKRVDIFFGDVKDAFFSPPNKQENRMNDFIVLPSANPKKTPIDLLDGLIFESCNAEIQGEYDTLTKFRTARLKGPDPLPIREYGRMKAQIESKATLKDAQLKFALRESGVEIAYQGERNLLAMLRVCREKNGGTLDDYEAILADPERLSEYLAANSKELGDFLDGAGRDEETKKAILLAMAMSPHKRGCDDDDKNGLNSDDLYAYELLETWSPSQIVTMVIAEIVKVANLSDDQLKGLRTVIQGRLMLYDVPKKEGLDRSHRNGLILDILDELKRYIPELAESELESLTFSPDMTRVAKLQQLKTREENGKFFGEEDVKHDKLVKKMESLFPAKKD